MLRCERMPALLLVGFEKNGASTAGFPTAVKSLVRLSSRRSPEGLGRWAGTRGAGRRGPGRTAPSQPHHRRSTGLLRRVDHEDPGAGSPPFGRCRGGAAKIVGLFARSRRHSGEAIRIAVTSQSTRRRITRKMCNELATALIVRSVPLTNAKVDQVRRYLRNAFGDAVYSRSGRPPRAAPRCSRRGAEGSA